LPFSTANNINTLESFSKASNQIQQYYNIGQENIILTVLSSYNPYGWWNLGSQL
jgi:hypothetical protein